MQTPINDTLEILKDPLIQFAETYGIHKISLFDVHINEWIKEMFERCHTFLQTKMMLNSSKTAKWSCIWAATAASIAFLATIAAWITVVLTIRGRG